MSLASDIAIQLKEFAFVLGLGGMFTTVRSAFVTLFIPPRSVKDLAQEISPLGVAAKAVTGRGVFILIALVAAFVAAACLYAVPLSGLDPAKLRSGDQVLTNGQTCAVYAIVVLSVVILCFGLWIDALRQRLLDLTAMNKT